MTEVIDIKTKKPVRIEQNSTSIAQYFNIWKDRAKETGVVSVFILTITDDMHVDWDLRTASEHHALLAYASLDDLKREILDDIFPEIEVEFEDIED